jgi:hypothetical protein
MLIEREIKFYWMNPNANSIDEDKLRSLASGISTTEVNGNGFRYQLIIATDPFAMRGFDYRAESGSITLVIAKSFAYAREAIQGLNRVGRLGDKCKRIVLASVPLINEE